jgi:methyl-accepting chemotaxis protein
VKQNADNASRASGLIDEIAFQTNLPAVRALAGHSATAAKEIKDLIQDSVKKVEDGSVLVAQSGQTLDQIVSCVKKVSDIIAEIAVHAAEHPTPHCYRFAGRTGVNNGTHTRRGRLALDASDGQHRADWRGL